MVRVLAVLLALVGAGAAEAATARADWVLRAEHAVWTSPDPTWQLRGAAARRARVPVLMYHLIHAAPAGAPYPDLWVPPRRFRAQIRALDRAGYRGVTLRDVLAAWGRGAPLPRRPVVVSFDDGYASQGAVAFRALRRLGWPGVLAPVTTQISPRELSRGRIRQMVAAGWEIDSHTVTHPDLTTLDDQALRRELTASRRWLQRVFGVRVDVICYPSGRHDARVETAARHAGYRAATTTDDGVAGPADARMALPRVRVNPSTSPQELVRRLAQDRARAG